MTDAPPRAIRCHVPGLDPVHFIARVECGHNKPKGLRYGVSGLRRGLAYIEVYSDGAGGMTVFADYGHFTAHPHTDHALAFAREFCEAWGGKRGRLEKLTQEDLDREYADEYERMNRHD